MSPAATGTANETRARILREARALFLERGYDGAAMSQLAKRSGVTTPALYWHFASKSDLCAAVLDRDYRNFLAQLHHRTATGSPDERLRAFATTYIELQIGDWEGAFIAGYTQLDEKVSEAAREAIKLMTIEIIDTLKRILRDGRETGAFAVPDLTLAAYALITMCEYVYVWYRPGGRLTPREIGEIYGELAANLVRPVTA
jgi:AcrR family transcriptional regulator